mgnify:CR=1 FL=1
MNISYTKINDYEIPNLKIEEKEKYNIGKYGLLKLKYLKNNQRILYYDLLIKNELNEYLYEIDIMVSELVNKLIKELAEKEGINEELKISNQMLWTSKMNIIKNIAEEIVYNEYIFN